MRRIVLSVYALMLMFLFCFVLASPAFAEGQAPIAKNFELKTYRNVSVGGTLSAYDPDGGAVSFEITTSPIKGDIKLEADGSFVYTPRENKKGRDYFGYKATDTDGNVSQEATVQIRIEKQAKSLCYSDMEGRAGAYAAVELNERGLFAGEMLGGVYCFCPDRAMTRGEFLRLTMQLTGKPLLSGVMYTSYEDDEEMDARTKVLAASAAMEGLRADASSFRAEESITTAEASWILNEAAGLEPVDLESEGMLQACMKFQTLGLLDAKETATGILTREQAALMLIRTAELLDAA